MRASPLFTSVLALVTVAALAGCRGQTSKDSPVVGIRGMYDQPRYDMQSKSAFFADRRSMRLPVEGTISREEIWDPEIGEGRLRDDTGYVLAVPTPVVEHMGGAQAMVTRGQERFNIYCTPCHDGTGSGHGMAVKHGMLAPPSFHQHRIRHMPDGQMFAGANDTLGAAAYRLTVVGPAVGPLGLCRPAAAGRGDLSEGANRA